MSIDSLQPTDDRMLNATTGAAASLPSLTRTSSRRSLRRAAKLSAVAATAAASVLTIGAQPAFASWQAAYTWTTVTLRDCYHPSKAAQPSTSCTAITVLPTNTNLHIICQHSGQTIDGDPVWDYVDTPYGQGYVTDAYVRTGYANWIPGVDVCNY
ncbi:MAG: hypothetical protein QOE23_2194 [Pseudonocardiales bacterium]|nr:hypothetical protein [Pseudonocardiales bacterium]